MTRMNHGFWNFSPTVYPDFMEANGFDLQVLTGVTGQLASGMRTFPVDPVGRFEAPASWRDRCSTPRATRCPRRGSTAW